MRHDSSNDWIWISPDWNVNDKYKDIDFALKTIWISPDWNVNKENEDGSEYDGSDLNITRLECKLYTKLH